MSEIKVKLHNDGKSKSQSYEAYLADDFLCGINPFHSRAYGKSKDEAITGLKTAVNIFINLLKNIDYSDIIKVAFNGVELQKYLKELEAEEKKQG